MRSLQPRSATILATLAFNPALSGKLSPDIDEAARAIARRQRWKIVPEGAWAANLLGLSTQVPAKIIYLTDGPNNEEPIGSRTIHFKHARPKAMAGLEGKYALVVQALRYLGKEGVGSREIETLHFKDKAGGLLTNQRLGDGSESFRSGNNRS